MGGVAGEMRTDGALRATSEMGLLVGDIVSVPDDRAEGESGRSS